MSDTELETYYDMPPEIGDFWDILVNNYSNRPLVTLLMGLNPRWGSASSVFYVFQEHPLNERFVLQQISQFLAGY